MEVNICQVKLSAYHEKRKMKQTEFSDFFQKPSDRAVIQTSCAVIGDNALKM